MLLLLLLLLLDLFLDNTRFARWLLLLAASFPLISRLHRAAVVALFTLALLAGFYAGSFEIIEERTHLIKYGTLAVLLCRDNSNRPPFATVIMAISGVLWVGSLDEIVQSFTPGRVGDVRDVWFNLVGGLFGVALWAILRWSGAFRPSFAS